MHSPINNNNLGFNSLLFPTTTTASTEPLTSRFSNLLIDDLIIDRNITPNISQVNNPLTPTSTTSYNFANYGYEHKELPHRTVDQNPPCNTLYVGIILFILGNLPSATKPEELEELFQSRAGYKRLCYRVRANGPMCFVEVIFIYI